MNSVYNTDISDNQWNVISGIIDEKPRKRKYSLRGIWNAIMYLLRSGCQWRMLPKDFAPWQVVYYYFRKWEGYGVIEQVLDAIRGMVRKQEGHEEEPSLGIIDSRSVKSSHQAHEARGIDGGKKVKGRKQHIVVDVFGFLIGLAVHDASIHDSVGANSVLEAVKGKSTRLAKILADGGYRGEVLASNVKKELGCELEIALRPEQSSKKFQIIPKRWIVERSISWIENYRRLSCDYENLACTAEAMVMLVFCNLMINRLHF
jgi:putative transposase